MSADFIEQASEVMLPLNSPHLIICFDDPETEKYRYIINIHDQFGRDKSKLIIALKNTLFELTNESDEGKQQ